MGETKAPAEPLPSDDWALLLWRTLEQYVYRQQKRIYKAAKTFDGSMRAAEGSGYP